ncbi:MAG: DUF1573 domain-containing protein [Planctomycetota bacterium]|jgi:hypothetical protein
MKSNCLILTAFAVGCVLLLQVGCQKEAKAPEESKTLLTGPNEPVIVPVKNVTVPEANKPGPKITFEKIVHDFGEIGPKTNNSCEFKFTNTGVGLLKIGKIEACCGFSARLKGNKRDYEPGESGTVIVTFSASRFRARITKYQHVNSNDKARPRIRLTVKAKIVPKVSFQPERLNLLLKDVNAGCPEITLTSVDNQPFAIKQFKSTANSITVDFNPSVKKTKFVLKPKVDVEILQRALNGRISISLTHPECRTVTIPYSTKSRFKATPPSIIVLRAEPQKPIKRKVWILNNYNEDFEIESASSQKGIIKVLSQEEIRGGYQFELEITPPAAEDKKRLFTDVFFVNIKGGEKVQISCRGFYSSRVAPRRDEGRLRRPPGKTEGPVRTN